MEDLKPTRQRFIVAAAILGAINLALLGYLLWPRTSQADVKTLQRQYDSLSRQVGQISDPAQTREDLKHLYTDDIPDRFSSISQQMEKLFQETGVTPQPIRYAPDLDQKSALPGVQVVKVDTTVTGDYTKVARFINALEQARLLFIIDKISLSSQEGGKVTLQITFNTFLKQTGVS